jgi:hypothetical protein
MRSFRGQFTAQALQQTCTVTTPTTTTPAVFGVSTAASLTTTTLACLEMPPREVVAHDHGTTTTIPMQLLIQDPTRLVTQGCRITYAGHAYRPGNLTRDGDFVQVTLIGG